MARTPLVAYQWPLNLRDMLVLPPVDRWGGAGCRTHRGFGRCSNTNCLCCIYL